MEKEQLSNGEKKEEVEKEQQQETSKEEAAEDESSSDIEDENLEERTVLLNDVILRVNELETDAMAVLGGSDETNCSYASDPPRQALYACKTCEMKVVDVATGEKELAGVCLACSNHCHDGHDLVELYTKRNFRCDCGTDKFASPDFTCKLFDKRGIMNDDNKYNHNFTGLYCTCKRPYPDEEDTVDDCMLQCGICEDWFHGRHLQKSQQPMKQPEFFDVICEQCVKKNNFLLYYLLGGCFENVGSVEFTDEEELDIETETVSKVDAHQTESMDSGIAEAASSSNQSSGGLIENNSTPSNEADKKDGSCQLAKFKAAYLAKHGTETIDESAASSIFFTSKWRQLLCKCTSCVELYAAHEIPFITSLEDMTYYYETNSLKMVEEREEKAFNSIPHVAKMEIIQSIKGFKERLALFLNNASSGGTETITKRHVETFFEDEYRRREDRKRQRTGLPPSDCGTAGR